MFDDLDFYLKKWTNSIRQAVIKDALLVLDQYGETGTQTAIALQLENSSSFSTSENLASIDAILTDGLKGVLLQMNINIDGSIQDLAMILRGLYTLTTIEEHDYILNEISLGGEPVDIITNLLEFVDFNAALAWQNCVNVYTNIPDGLINRLRTTHEAAIANESANPEPITTEEQSRFARIRFFLGKYTESLAYKMVVEDRVPVGLPMATLLGMYRSALLLLDVQQPLIMASSLIGMVMMSDTTPDRIMAVAKDTVDDVWADRVIIEAVEKAMDTMALDVGRSA